MLNYEEKTIIFTSTIIDSPMGGQKRFYFEEMGKKEIQEEVSVLGKNLTLHR